MHITIKTTKIHNYIYATSRSFELILNYYSTVNLCMSNNIGTSAFPNI